jgi:serpin B
MLILLPNQDDGLDRLDRLEAQLCAELLGGMKLENQEVRVSLPRFTLNCEARLDEALKAQGMAAAFDKDKADFSGINGVRQPDPESLHIAAVLHRSFVEVNEKGTEAAAAAAVHLEAKNGHTPPIFTADHPFVFAIRDRQTGAVLFLGRVANPAAEKEPDKAKR